MTNRFRIKQPGAREYGLPETLGFAIASTPEKALAAFREAKNIPGEIPLTAVLENVIVGVTA